MKRISIIVLILFSVSIFPNPLISPLAVADSHEDPPYLSPSLSPGERASDLLSRMTLDEKVGQMTQIERRFLKNNSDIAEYNLGSLLSGGGSAPDPNNPTEWARMYNEYQRYAVEETRLGIPLLYGVDATHGHNNVMGAVIFPQNVGMGSTWNSTLVERCARTTAVEVSATGLDWTFSPVVDVARDDRWGRTYESFGEDPYLCRVMGASKVHGYQGENLARDDTILATGKHYLGSGGTTDGEDQGNCEAPMRIIREKHLEPFIGTIEADTQTIMASFCSVNGEKIHGRGDLLTKILKEEQGFNNFLVSDWSAIRQVDPIYSRAVKKCINAGIDMSMVPDDYESFQSTVKDLINDNEIPMSRIDNAVYRILLTKFRLGLFEDPYVEENAAEVVGCENHREVARQAVRESVVLLKNDGILPISKGSSVFVTGPNAANMANLCGGWTIGWQGAVGNPPRGTTILEAIEDTTTGKVTFSPAGLGAEGHDVAVVVVGEEPYAEGRGDTNNLSLPSDQLSMIDRVVDSGVPTVVIMVSGRPRTGIESRLDDWGAFLMAWLPGTEGQGVADVLFGDYNPSGELSRSWPRETSQEPINYDRRPDEDYDPLFEFGYGLSYTEFEYENLRVSPSNPDKEDNVEISVEVSNVGDRVGSEAVQVYLNDVESTLSTPVKKLYRFDKVEIEPGETKTLNFVIPVAELGYYTSSPRKVVEPGSFKVMVGGLTTSFEAVEVAEEKFEFTNLKISKEEIEPGEPVDISFEVKNTGDEEKTQEVEINFDGTVKREEVTLSPGETETVEVTLSENEMGVHWVSVGPLTGEFKVVESKEQGGVSSVWIIGGILVALLVIGIVLYGKKRS